MEVFTAATLALLIVKVVSFLKFLLARSWNDALTQAVVWVGGTVVLLIAAQADVTQGLVIWGTQRLGALDFWSLVLAGLSLSSTGSFGFDVKSAIDNTDSAAEPQLLGPRRGPDAS